MMQRKRTGDAGRRRERSRREPDRSLLVLRLFVAGTSPASMRAIATLNKLCKEGLKVCVDLAVIDVFQQPEAAQGQHIVAMPTLIKFLPAPLQRFTGDLAGLEDKLFGGEGRLRGKAPKK